MIYPNARAYLLDLLKRRASKAVEQRKTVTEFTLEIAALLRREENALGGLGDETTGNYEAFALFLGFACATFGRLDTIEKIKGVLNEPRQPR